MKVFTIEWEQKIRRRYESLPGHLRPSLYNLVTSPKLEKVRLEVEKWVSDLPVETQEKVAKKLQSAFFQTYHELAAGNILQQLGYEAEYEKPINGLTPDWYVRPEGETPSFIVEVFTANRSEEDVKQDKKVNDLLARLNQIPIGVALNIHLDYDEVQLSQKQNKDIAKKVKDWLLNNRPDIGAQLDLNGIAFELILRNDAFKRVQTISPGGAFWVNSKILRDKFEKKIDKYKKFADERNIPIVVVSVADPLTGYDYEDFEEALLQHTTYEVTYNKSTGEELGQKPKLKKDGLCFTNKELSAALWLWESSSTHWEFKTIHNPIATNPLPLSLFEKKR